MKIKILSMTLVNQYLSISKNLQQAMFAYRATKQQLRYVENISNMKAVRGQITCVFTVQLFVKIDENKNPDNI
jgi:ribosomal protein L29